MTNREVFINYVEPMMDQAPEEAVKYFETIKNKKEKEAPEITELGYRILAAMQTDPECEFTAKMLGEAVSAIAGFIAIVVNAYKTNETFRKNVDTVFNNIKSIILPRLFMEIS